MTIDPVIAWLLRLSLALLFATASWHKLRHRRRFDAALKAYRLLPATSASSFGWLLPLMEVSVAVGLVHPSSCRAAAVGAVVLLVAYTVAIAVNLARGRREIDCGCFGPTARVPLSAGLLLRNIGLIAASSILLLPVGARNLIWVDCMTVLTSVVALSLMWNAVGRLARTGAPLRQLGGAR